VAGTAALLQRAAGLAAAGIIPAPAAASQCRGSCLLFLKKTEEGLAELERLEKDFPVGAAEIDSVRKAAGAAKPPGKQPLPARAPASLP
jgi:hypothetical protein